MLASGLNMAMSSLRNVTRDSRPYSDCAMLKRWCYTKRVTPDILSRISPLTSLRRYARQVVLHCHSRTQTERRTEDPPLSRVQIVPLKSCPSHSYPQLHRARRHRCRRYIFPSPSPCYIAATASNSTSAATTMQKPGWSNCCASSASGRPGTCHVSVARRNMYPEHSS